MRLIVLFLLLNLLILPLRADNNIFNKNTTITPLALASGGQVSISFLDSYNIYNLPSYLGLQNKSYYEFSFLRDGFEDNFFNLSYLNANQSLAVFHYGIKVFYNDFSDNDFSYRDFGLTSGFSFKIIEKMFGGISFLLMKNSFNCINNLSFLSSYSITYNICYQGFVSAYIKNLGSDLTDFGQYNDSYYLDYGLVYHQQYKNLVGQVVLNTSKYNDTELNVSAGYNFNFYEITLLPLIGFDYYDGNNLSNGLSYGLALKTKFLAVEFGFKVIEGQAFYSLALKKISY